MERVKNLETARMNPPVYGERHVRKVVSGTRETLPRTGYAGNGESINPQGEMRNCGKGVGGGHTTEEARTTQPCGGKGAERQYPTSFMGYEGGKSE